MYLHLSIIYKAFALLFSWKVIYLSTPQVEQLQGHDLLVVSPNHLWFEEQKCSPRSEVPGGAKRALGTHASGILRETMHLGTYEPFCTLTN